MSDEVKNLPAPSHLTDEQHARIEQMLEERLREQKKSLIAGRKQYFVMRLISHALITSIPMIILALLLTPIGDILGIRLGWFGVPPLPSGTAPAGGVALQAKAVLESMRDLLTVIVPLFLGVAIWLVTIVAERRLKEYDATLDKFRDSSSTALDKFRESSSKEYADFRKEIKEYDATLDKFRESSSKEYAEFRKEITEAEKRIGERVEGSVVAKVVGAAKESIKELTDDARESFENQMGESRKELIKIHDTIEKRFGPLADSVSYVKDIGAITSVGMVKDKVVELFSRKKVADAVNLTLELLNVFISCRDEPSRQRPSGTLGDWFNLSAVLGQCDQEGLALRVCFAGLEQQCGLPLPERIGEWPTNRIPEADLLAHAIKYASAINSSELENLLTLSGYNATEGKGRADWPWRSYTFVMDGLESIGRSDEAVALAYDYLGRAGNDPDQQKVVSNLAGILSTRGERAKASEILHKWLKDHPNLPAAQVITRLIDWELGSADPEQIIGWINRGIRDLAEEQPSASLGNLVYCRALTKDWQAHGADDRKDFLEAQAFARSAMQDYRLALDTGVNKALREQIENRQKLLKVILSSEYSDRREDDAEDSDHGNASDRNGDGSENVVQAAFQKLMTMLLALKKPDDAAYGMISREFEALPESARETIVLNMQRIAGDEDCPSGLRDNIQWFVERHQSSRHGGDAADLSAD